MKNLLILVVCMTCWCVGLGQEDVIAPIRKHIDFTLQKIEQEKNAEKRFDLIMGLYDTQLESYPLLMLETFHKLLAIAHKNNDQIVESNAYSLAGQGYRLSANYIKALEYHHKAIALAEQSENIAVLGWAHHEIGHVYKDREENKKAISFYNSAKEKFMLVKMRKLEGWAMMNLAAVYLTANQPDSSLFYGKLGYEKVVGTGGFGPQAAYIFSNIASAYSKKSDNINALEYYSKAIDQAIESQSPIDKGIVYTSYAEHFQRTNQIDSCIVYAKKAITAVQNSLFSYMVIKPSKMLMDIYENKNADSTITYLKLSRAANDSLYNTRANQQLQMMTFEEDARQRNLETEKISYRNKIRTNIMLAGIVLFLLIAIFLYRNNLQRKKINKELQETLAHLKSTQSQLIQSEKMASLGELTAGIAHEIQNPLNFVNNFSEVSSELADEMDAELNKGDIEEAKLVAADIKQNLIKINHHGKRADAIVKGMLQHSRSSNGQKELTDLNALCDEYLRLSYHGLRAKDKSFNATLETDFDKSIGKIKIVPQDIGRVIMNLLTNAFYAVNEKSKKENYSPTVIIRTRRVDEKLEITVSDNGNGIPAAVIDKIFQPFFTTKPTGQGTGLGLSLSYDIIKTHGGELTVKTTEGEGTHFKISLPIFSI